MRNLTITLDGPAAAGKGSLARALAGHYGLPRLDTGLLYRAVAYLESEGRGALEAAQGLSAKDVADGPHLRSRFIGEAASKLAAREEIREALLGFQREFAARPGGAVLDGRDTGTIICPDALAKIFVTASDHVRARRRHAELIPSDPDLTLDEVLADLKARDARDAGRDIAPLTPAPGALLLDTSELSIAAALREAVRFIDQKLAG